MRAPLRTTECDFNSRYAGLGAKIGQDGVGWVMADHIIGIARKPPMI